MEGTKTQWKGINGHPPDKERPQWLLGSSTCLVAGGSIQAAPGPTSGLRVAGCPTWVQWTPPHGFPIPYWCLWPMGFLDCEAGEDPGLSLDTASLQWRVRGPNRHSLWVSIRSSNVYGPHDDSQWWQHCWSLLSNVHRTGTWDPHTRGGKLPF